MQNHNRRDDGADTFRNPETRERWQWVRHAIDVAEMNSILALQERAENEVATAPSPFE